MWAVVLKPFVLLVLFFLIALLVLPIKKYLPEGRLKRFLFFSWRV
jgi:hypothetical protein